MRTWGLMDYCCCRYTYYPVPGMIYELLYKNVLLIKGITCYHYTRYQVRGKAITWYLVYNKRLNSSTCSICLPTERERKQSLEAISGTIVHHVCKLQGFKASSAKGLLPTERHLRATNCSKHAFSWTERTFSASDLQIYTRHLRIINTPSYVPTYY